jgi:TatD DNase family protein
VIDSHCHLTYDPLAGQIDAVLRRAEAAGVAGVITIGTTLEDSRRALDLAMSREEVACTVGVHPSHAHEAPADVAGPLADLAGETKVIAIGETGIDLYHDRTHADRQQVVFIEQMRLAERLSKPVVIHSRSAVHECLAVMADFPGVSAVFHCFTGTIDEARRVLERGYYLGFTGPVTYRKSDELREVVRICPTDRLLVETDAPYLSPEPMRGKFPNEPAWVMHTAAKVAEVRGVGVEEIDAVTTENCRRLFGWAR